MVVYQQSKQSLYRSGYSAPGAPYHFLFLFLNLAYDSVPDLGLDGELNYLLGSILDGGLGGVIGIALYGEDGQNCSNVCYLHTLRMPLRLGSALI